MLSMDFDQHYTRCGRYDGVVADGDTVSIDCDTPVYGQYVAIVMIGLQEIALCEVYVFTEQG